MTILFGRHQDASCLPSRKGTDSTGALGGVNVFVAYNSYLGQLLWQVGIVGLSVEAVHERGALRPTLLTLVEDHIRVGAVPPWTN